MLQATYRGGTNKDTADEVASILNQAYQSPLYQAKEPFRGVVVYEEKGDFLVNDKPVGEYFQAILNARN